MGIKRTLTAIGVVCALALPSGVMAAKESGGKGAEQKTGEYKQKGAHAAYSLGADEITGMSVKSRDGKDVGSIYKVVLNTETGRVEYLVVASGGVLGVGERKYVIPWQAFNVRKSG